MTHTPKSPTPALPAPQGLAWIAAGGALMGRDLRLWLWMGGIYMTLAILLSRIPFVGWLFLVLLSPILLHNSMLTAHRLATVGAVRPGRKEFEAGAAGWRGFIKADLDRGLRGIFSGLNDEERVMPLLVVSVLALGGVVVIQILAQLLKVGGPAIPAMLAGSVGPKIWIPALIGLTVILGLQTLLTMALLYAAPLIAFRKSHPLPAMESSFGRCSAQFAVFAVFAGSFALVALALRLLFYFLGFPLDYLVFFGVGMVMTPLFATSLYASYGTLYGRPK